MSDWPEIRLGDVLSATRGATYKGVDLEDPEADTRLLSITAIRPGGGFKPSGLRPFSGGYRDPHRCRPGDIVVALTDLTQDGSMLGSPALVPESEASIVASHHVARIHDVDPAINTDWLYFRLQADDWGHRSDSYATGTTVRQFRPDALVDWSLPVPSRRVQDGIASVLRALENKITSNRRLGTLLQQSATAIFHQTLGGFIERTEDLPSGWKAAKVAEVIEINPKVPVRKGDEVPFIPMNALEPFATRPHRSSTRVFRSGSRFAPGDSLFAKITPCTEHGKGAFVDFLDRPGAGSTEFMVLRSRGTLAPEAVFLLSRHPRFRHRAITSMVGSSGRQRVPAAAVAEIELGLPPASSEEWSRASSAIAATFRRSLALWRQTRTLEEVRSALLPLLVTGRRPLLTSC